MASSFDVMPEREDQKGEPQVAVHSPCGAHCLVVAHMGREAHLHAPLAVLNIHRKTCKKSLFSMFAMIAVNYGCYGFLALIPQSQTRTQLGLHCHAFLCHLVCGCIHAVKCQVDAADASLTDCKHDTL